jgi:hypothetical protein
MLLDLDQRKIVLAVLAELFTTRDELGTFLTDELGKNLDEITTGNLEVARSDVLKKAEARGWTVDLIKALHQLNVPGASLQLNRIGTIQEIQEARFFDACYIDHYPMVNRRKLRDKLRTVVTEQSRRIMVVKGQRHGGNSHTVRHLRHIAGRFGIALAEFPLISYATGEELEPRDFGIEIAQALNRTLPQHLDAKPSRWSINFINWLASQSDAERLWIVFDDFEKDKLKVALPETIYDFIRLLCEGVANRIKGVRLFLINYDRSLPNEIAFQIDFEDVPGISEEDLVDFFLDFYRDHVQPADLEAAAKDAAERARAVVSKMPADPADRLHRMRDALTAECEQLQGK